MRRTHLRLLRPRPRACAALAVVAACSWPLFVLADDDALVTDRPDFVESSLTVGKGRVQIETSVAYDRGKQDVLRVRTWSTPTLLRVGFAKDWELRVETDGRGRARIEDSASGARETLSGWNDVAIGAKWHLQDGDEKRNVPSTALLAHLDFDSGSGAFRGNGLRPSLRYVAEWEFADDWSLGVMPGVFSAKDADGSRYTGGILAITVGKSFSDTFRGFVELSGEELTSKRHGGNVANARAGVAYLLSKDVQLDTAIAAGLTRETPDVGVTLGLSIRF